MYLFDLPDELLTLCCSQVDQLDIPYDEDAFPTSAQVNLAALRNLRLTSKRISPIATKQLFFRLNLLPTKDSAQRTRAVLDCEHLNPLVNIISTQTSLFNDRIHEGDPPPCWNCHDIDDPDWGTEDIENDEEHSIDSDGEPSATFKRTLNDIGLFRNLRRIELAYDDRVEGPSGDENKLGIEVMESMQYRDAFFGKLLRALNHPNHPASKLTSLSIMNLQDWVNVDIATSPDFTAVLSRLESLELCIVSEQDEAAYEHEMSILERHDFYSTQLRKYWLQPLQEIGRLTSLKLYGSIPWGYLPRSDFRGLHFPNLRHLALGNMTFTHDWQLEWILSHHGTLSTLSLHNCPIIPDTELIHSVDDENYPILPRVRPATGRGRKVKATWKYSARWHDYFDRFRSELCRLRRFAVTHGTWVLSYGGPSDAAKRFVGVKAWPAGIRVSRYCMMRGLDPMQWSCRPGPDNDMNDEAIMRANANQQYSGFHMNSPKALQFLYPDCWEEDQRTLDELLVAIRERG